MLNPFHHISTRWKLFARASATVALVAILSFIAINQSSYDSNLATLHELQRQNQADTVFHSDSLQRHLADYFDWRRYMPGGLLHPSRTANERMLAHYLLGRALADMGDAPAAIEAYLDAVDCADTTNTRCDFSTLSSIYSQMADVLHHQLLLSQSIESRNKSIHYSLLIGDTINAIYDYGRNASTYFLMNMRDSAERLLLKTKKMYLDMGLVRNWAVSSRMLIYLYLHENRNMPEVRSMMTLFEKENNIQYNKGET